MRFSAFSSRNIKELLRDPISIAIGMGIPLMLLLLISAIQKNVPVEIFKIQNFAPGIAVFSFSFISMFAGMLLSKDRSSSFLMRLFASPLTATDYIVGYSLPLLILTLLQSIVCFVTAIFLGLEFNINVLIAILVLIPVALFFIALGLLLGCILTDKQVGGIGSILIQIAALSSGMWFDLTLIGGVIEKIARALPFVHAVDMAKSAITGNFSAILPDMLWVLGYAFVTALIAIYVFKKKMSSGNE